MKNEVKHTAHSSYRCQYHIVFAPKYRREVIYKQIRKDIGEIFRKLCNEMKVEIIEAEACVDHIHMVALSMMLAVSLAAGFLLCGKYGFALLGCMAGYGLALRRGYQSLEGMNGDISGYALTLGELCAVAVYALI